MVSGCKPSSGVRKPLSAYRFFTKLCKDEYHLRYPKDRKFRMAIEKTCKERWKLCSPQMKSRFSQMAEEDRARYEREMGKPFRGKRYPSKKKKKAKKDPFAPKKPRSASIMFVMDQSKILAATESGGSINSSELLKLWTDLGPKERAKYIEKAKQDKERYRKELELYRKKTDRPNGEIHASGMKDSDESELDD